MICYRNLYNIVLSIWLRKHCCDRAMVVEVSLSSFNDGFTSEASPFMGATPYPPGFAVVLVYGVPGITEMQQAL